MKRRLLGLFFSVLPTVIASAAEPELGFSFLHLNLESPTMGGLQVWSDLRIEGAWRIQRNAMTGHCRLLDDTNVRRMWGTYDHCENELLQCMATAPPRTPPRRLVVTLHGLGATRRCMESIGSHLKSNGEFDVVNVSYASTRGDFAYHAAGLKQILSHLQDADELNFVCHSMGNLVLRQYIDDCQRDPQQASSLLKIKRVVMLGPPNQGAQLAERFRDLTILEPVVGLAASRLAKEGREYTANLARPTCEFGIIAGGQGDGKGRNPLLSGDDDLVVRVEETRLAGARDFLVVAQKHRSMLYDPQVHDRVLNFLNHGFFVSEADRHPIPAE